MFAIDKQKFGAFVAQLRKEKGYTQKELAERLFISDKAVSKWETAVSVPDIALLIPLGELLGVSVTELLLCERIKADAPMDAGQVEGVVKTALSYSDEKISRAYQRKSQWMLVYLAALLVGAGELVWFYSMGRLNDTLWIMVLLGAIFGAYFCFFARERVPSYHDENRISSYGDGPFRMNLPGTAINNSNWPYIVLVGKLWTVLTMTVYPLLCFLIMRWQPELWRAAGHAISAVLVVCGLFVPMVIVGKKYE